MQKSIMKTLMPLSKVYYVYFYDGFLCAKPQFNTMFVQAEQIS